MRTTPPPLLNIKKRKVSFIFQKKSYYNNLIPIISILSLSVDPLSKNPGDDYAQYCSGYYNFPITDYVKPKPITRSARNSCKLDMSVPFFRTKLFQNSYFNRIPKLWINLPPCTLPSSSVSIFKTALYKHYLIALSNSFCPDTYNTWRTICPKCSACNDFVSPPTCCYLCLLLCTLNLYFKLS